MLPVLFFAGCSGNKPGTASLPLQFDKYGGLSNISGNNTSGFFRTQTINKRWVFVDPDNHAFLSLGADGVGFGGAGNAPLFGFSPYNHNLLSLFPSYASQYTMVQWVQETISRYKELGFNTLGNWADNGLTVFQDAIPYTIPMDFIRAVADSFSSHDCPVVNQGYWNSFPDVYDPRFSQNAIAYARQTITPGLVQDPWLIGYFTDNEINWFGGAQFLYNPAYTLADDFIALPPTYAGKQYWVNVFLRQKLGYTLDRLNQLYGTTFANWTDVLNATKLANSTQYPQIQTDKQAFIYDIASTYFSVTNAAIKSVDPNHLNLCARFASDAPDQVIEAASQYCDVISVNDYYTLDNSISNATLGDPVKRWTRFFTLSMMDNTYGKPFIQSEFGIRAQDSGLPNERGAGWTVKTQNERADYYKSDVNRLLGIKVSGVTFLAGFHWFEWSDEPATGRFDGENSNYGFVNIKDEPYATFFSNIADATKTLMSTLAGAYGSVLNPVDFITATSGNNGLVALSWTAVSGAGSYTVILSPYRSMPERFTLTFTDITTNNFVIPYQLPQGRWWFDVKALGLNGIQGDYITPASFSVTVTAPDIQSCMAMDNLGCFVNNIPDTFPNPDNAIGDGFVLPEQAIRDQGTGSGKVTFTLNSLAFQAGLPVSAIVTMGMNQPIPLDGTNTLSFDVYPEVVYTPSGQYRSATDFVHIRLFGNGTTVYDSPLPSSLPPYSWSTVGISVSGSAFTEVTPVFYIDAHASDIPWDQRIVFYLDNVKD